MPNTASVNTAVTTQQTQNDKVREATDFVKKMERIIAARRLEEMRGSMGV